MVLLTLTSQAITAKSLVSWAEVTEVVTTPDQQPLRSATVLVTKDDEGAIRT